MLKQAENFVLNLSGVARNKVDKQKITRSQDEQETSLLSSSNRETAVVSFIEEVILTAPWISLKAVDESEEKGFTSTIKQVRHVKRTGGHCSKYLQNKGVMCLYIYRELLVCIRS